MPDSVRKQIMAAIATRFATITTGNGYKTSAGSTVSTWRDLEAAPWTSADLPAINIRDVEQEVEAKPSSLQIVRLAIECDVAGASIAVVRDIISDIQAAIGTDEKWSTLARRTEYEQDSVGVEHAKNKLAAGVVRFVVVYQQARWDPDSNS